MISDSNIRTQFLDSVNSNEGTNIIARWEQEQLLADDLE